MERIAHAGLVNEARAIREHLAKLAFLPEDAKGHSNLVCGIGKRKWVFMMSRPASREGPREPSICFILSS